MEIASLDITKQTVALGSLSGRGVEGFAAKMREAASGKDAKSGAREAAEQLVATTLVAPLLAELREQPLDTKLFHGGFGEDAFRQQLDTKLADEIVKSSRFPLVDRIYAQITRRAELAQGAGVNLHG